MGRLCSCCRKPTAPNATTRPMVAEGLCYLLIWECDCGSTLAVTMWESEE